MREILESTTPEERVHPSMINKANIYIWNIIKANGVKDQDIKTRVKVIRGTELFKYHILIDDKYYCTVHPSKYYNHMVDYLSSESGYYHYFSSEDELKFNKK